MACHISFRDVSFHASTTGVRIIVITDIPCHLFCRLTLEEPHIHKKPSYRRGLWLNDDVRFCFDIFEDNEQFEPGDTLIHTFWKTAWPPCTTKYCYFWGSIAGEVCSSTSPLFTYHNDGVDPVPPPEVMYQLNTIDPEFYALAGGSAWSYLDVSRDVPEGATGAIWQFYQADTGVDRDFALRKPGASYDSYQPFEKDGTLWAIVGLDDQRRFQYRFGYPGYLHGYLMGYTGRDVVFPDDPIDIKPALNNAYSTFDIKATWPASIIILTDLGSSQAWNNYHSIRPQGSTKEVFAGGHRKFPFCGIPEGGNIQTKLSNRDGPSTQWLAYAYLKKDCTICLNGVDYVGFTSNAWKTLALGSLNPDIRWAFLEYKHPYTAEHVGARKQFSYFAFTGRNDNHGWMLTHVDHTPECQVYSGTTAASDELLQIAESH